RSVTIARVIYLCTITPIIASDGFDWLTYGCACPRPIAVEREVIAEDKRCVGPKCIVASSSLACLLLRDRCCRVHGSAGIDHAHAAAPQDVSLQAHDGEIGRRRLIQRWSLGTLAPGQSGSVVFRSGFDVQQSECEPADATRHSAANLDRNRPSPAQPDAPTI